MTVANLPNYYSFTGSGSTGPFTFAMEFFENSDISVSMKDLNDVVTTLVENIDYTLTGAGLNTGGSVTLTNVLPSGYILTILRTMPIEQNLLLVDGGLFSASAIMAALDYLTMICQQLQPSGGGVLPVTTVVIKEVLSADAVIPYPGGMKMIMFIDPNGANRNIDFTGAYPQGFEVVCFDLGANALVLDSVAAAIVVTPGPGKSIFTDGTSWYSHS